MVASGLRISIVGAGLMGHGIAQVFALEGASVVVQDPVPEALASVPERIAANLKTLGEDPAVAASVALEEDLEAALEGADFVFEAAPEDLDLKQELFARLDRAAPPAAILASNTSVMRIGDIAARARHGERIVGTHWWNPPFLVPLVEVVQADRTAQGTVARTMELLESVGKTPVHVRRDVPGFIGNRLQHALWRQAFELVDAGVCGAEDIDTVIKASFGRRLAVLGPMENADLVGLELTMAIHDYVLPTLDPPSEPARGLRRRVEQGKLGMAAGQGWRKWTPEEAAETRRRMLEHLAAARDDAREQDG
jgi:3-hydroxybutyryl-CoA dehydrogenase